MTHQNHYTPFKCSKTNVFFSRKIIRNLHYHYDSINANQQRLSGCTGNWVCVQDHHHLSHSSALYCHDNHGRYLVEWLISQEYLDVPSKASRKVNTVRPTILCWSSTQHTLYSHFHIGRRFARQMGNSLYIPCSSILILLVLHSNKLIATDCPNDFTIWRHNEWMNRILSHFTLHKTLKPQKK